MVAGIIWLFFAGCLVWFIVERKKPKEKQDATSITIIAFVSWFVFRTLHRAVISSRGTEVEALLAGALFGGIVLLICICIKWFLTKKKQTPKEG